MDKKPENSNSNDGDVTRNQITVASEIIPEDIDDDPNGFAININDFDSHGEPKTPTWYLRASSPEEKKEWLSLLFKLHGIVCWLDFYEKIRVLGTGGSGIVYELKHKRSGQRYALKEMEMKNREQLKCAVREAEMLMEITQHISHPNIMRIEKVFQVSYIHVCVCIVYSILVYYLILIRFLILLLYIHKYNIRWETNSTWCSLFVLAGNCMRR